MSSPNEEPIESLESATNCPRCGNQVTARANRCRKCGEYFPNVEQRVGNPWGGAACGLVRGIGIIAFVVGGAAGIQLVVGRGGMGNVATMLIGLIIFSTCLVISARLHQRTYKVR